ncbi:hypothetical protein [Brevundimonas sp. Root1423]|uniref:hypothetical protein n=1 Tax=Brevundimonas sp. Root1423 TaxID=1736462 RepID=UPI0012E3ACA3|nr:hypothetical protein [Brevundimonas sp. Root1423]
MTQPFAPAAFPYARPRRLRSSPWVRRLVAETTLTPLRPPPPPAQQPLGPPAGRRDDADARRSRLAADRP